MSDKKQTTDVAGLDEIIPAREATPFQKTASGEKFERPSKPATPRKLPFSVSGLIACIIAAAALWIAFAQNHRMDEVENQIAIMHAQMARTHEAMALLNNRQTDIEQHLDDLARLKGTPEKTTDDHEEASSESTSSAVEPPANEPSANAESTPSQVKTTDGQPEAAKEETPPAAAVKPAATPQPAMEAEPAANHTPALDSDKTTHPALAQTGNAPWKVNLVSGTSEKAIRKETERLQALGVPAAYAPLQIKGKTWYRIYIPGFASKEAAQKKATELRKQLHMDDIWIGK